MIMIFICCIKKNYKTVNNKNSISQVVDIIRKMFENLLKIFYYMY